jgi:hypothetical protein
VEQGPKILFPPEQKQEKLILILDLLEGLKGLGGWDIFSEDEKRVLIEIAATQDLSSEMEDRLKKIMPSLEEMNDTDRAFYFQTLYDLGLATKKEIGE